MEKGIIKIKRNEEWMITIVATSKKGGEYVRRMNEENNSTSRKEWTMEFVRYLKKGEQTKHKGVYMR